MAGDVGECTVERCACMLADAGPTESPHQTRRETTHHSITSTQGSTHNTSPTPAAAAHRTVFELRPMAFAFQAE